MRKSLLALALACLAPLVLAGSCSTVDANRNGANMLGIVKLGPFPRQPAWCAGYNLYFSDSVKGPFQKINTEPVLGYSNLMVPYLKPGKTYYFYMTAISKRDPSREGRPGGMFARVARQSWN